MIILAFNTTNSQLGVVLLQDQKVLAQVEFDENSNQAEFLIVEIEKILRTQNIWYQDLSAIATIKGPGSFTGVRIGLVAAKMIKLTTNLPLFTFDALSVLANENRAFEGKIFAIIDAKMDEFFIGEFLSQNNKIKTIMESRLVQLHELKDLNLDQNHLIIGNGKNILQEIFARKNIDLKTHHNEDKICTKTIALMAFEALILNDFQGDSNPLYLRQPRISTRNSRKIEK